mmetsp:Transcript_5896/g.13005  ORF Transcript_5896/g.13005 Transcript_5896/m.13005 type:complete len:225 (-) Transcript_5896:195-869(-)
MRLIVEATCCRRTSVSAAAVAAALTPMSFPFPMPVPIFALICTTTSFLDPRSRCSLCAESMSARLAKCSSTCTASRRASLWCSRNSCRSDIASAGKMRTSNGTNMSSSTRCSARMLKLQVKSCPAVMRSRVQRELAKSRSASCCLLRTSQSSSSNRSRSRRTLIVCHRQPWMTNSLSAFGTGPSRKATLGRSLGHSFSVRPPHQSSREWIKDDIAVKFRGDATE